jgi:hypothetical protein
MKKIVLILALMLTLSPAAEYKKVTTYEVPIGMVESLNNPDTLNRIEQVKGLVELSKQDAEYSNHVIQSGGVTVIMSSGDKNANFNNMLDLLYQYARMNPNVNAETIRDAVSILKVQ